MNVIRTNQPARGIQFSVRDGAAEIARAYLYMMHNDLHKAPFRLLEDVFVEESHRGDGLGTQMVQQVISAAKESGFHKLIATSRASRPAVHELYRRLGLQDRGIEFRIDFDAESAPAPPQLT